MNKPSVPQSVPTLSCDDYFAKHLPSVHHFYKFPGTSLNIIDNGQSGEFTIDEYGDNMNCFIDFGSQCDENLGAIVELTHLTVEDFYAYDDTSQQICWKDRALFAYTVNGTQMYSKDYCGCMHHKMHHSCQDFKDKYYDMYDMYFALSPEELTETLPGTDLKFIFTSDRRNAGGKVSVKWQCVAPPKASNTIEMAEALMTGAFQPSDATDYGCAGRGTFDAFSPTIGQALDDNDHAFFAWKKCIQCASNGDQSKIGAYYYDINNDDCGEFFLFLFI